MKNKTLINQENGNTGNNLLLVGQVVDTYFGWSGHITLINESIFKFGQGIYIIRLNDHHTFCIGPEDVIMPQC